MAAADMLLPGVLVAQTFDAAAATDEDCCCCCLCECPGSVDPAEEVSTDLHVATEAAEKGLLVGACPSIVAAAGDAAAAMGDAEGWYGLDASNGADPGRRGGWVLWSIERLPNGDSSSELRMLMDECAATARGEAVTVCKGPVEAAAEAAVAVG